MRERLTYTTIDGRTVDAGRNTDDVVRKRRRWDPLQAGTLAVARIEAIRDPSGEIRIVDGKAGFRAVDLLLHLDAAPGARGTGRRGIRCRIVIGGESPALLSRVRHDRAQLMRAASCYYLVADLEKYLGRAVKADDVDGLLVPIKLGIEVSFSTGQPQNTATILSADPRSATYDRYLALAKRLKPTKEVEHCLDDGVVIPCAFADALPGWRLYPDSPAHRLHAGRLAGKYARKAKGSEAFEMRLQSLGKPRKKGAPDLQIVPRADAPAERAIERMTRNVGTSLADAGGVMPRTPEPVDPDSGLPLTRRELDDLRIAQIKRMGGPGRGRMPMDVHEAARRGAAKRLQEDLILGGFKADQMRRK